jgi:hypothetical protein
MANKKDDKILKKLLNLGRTIPKPSKPNSSKTPSAKKSESKDKK